MDADTLGLATALSVLGIYGLADLVEMARANTLNEMILSAVELHDLEQHVAHAVAAANLMPVAVTAYAEVGTATDGCAIQDASTTAAFTPPAAQLVLKVGNVRAKDKSCQAAVRTQQNHGGGYGLRNWLCSSVTIFARN